MLERTANQNDRTMKVEGGAAAYDILASETFREDATWMDEVNLLVYSK